MKILLLILIVTGLLGVFGFRYYSQKVKEKLQQNTSSEFYSFTYTSIDGHNIGLKDYKGKFILFVNVASECGNTPQYVGLEELYQKYKDKLVIIGFPCNQFGFQEPGDEKEIASFCTKNYGITFPLSSKIEVKGSGQHPIYTWLTSKTLNGVSDDRVEWNFHKFLVSPEGKWLHSFAASMDPLNGEIEKYLK